MSRDWLLYLDDLIDSAGALLLRGKNNKRLTWEETYRETAREKEDWSDLDATMADGIGPGETK